MIPAPQRIVSVGRGQVAAAFTNKCWKTAHAQACLFLSPTALGWTVGKAPQKGGWGLAKTSFAHCQKCHEEGRHARYTPMTETHKVNSGTQQPRRAVIWTVPRIVQTPSSIITYEERFSTSVTSSLPCGVENGTLGPYACWSLLPPAKWILSFPSI